MSALEISFYVWSWVCLLTGVYAGYKNERGGDLGETIGKTLLSVVFLSLIFLTILDDYRTCLGIVAYLVGLVTIIVAGVHPVTSKRDG